jgi:MFS family permease
MNKKVLQWLYLLSAGVYFVQGIEGLHDSSIFFYFKETLNLSPSKIMYISSLVGLAWLVKPLIGWVIDFFKISKRFWIVGSLIISILISLIMGSAAYLGLPLLILGLFLTKSNAAIRDVANDGQMCIIGKKYEITGAIQAVQWIAITIASVLTGVAGGWIAENFNYQVAFLSLLPIYLLVGLLAWFYKEEVPKEKKQYSLVSTMKTLFTNKELLLVSLFLFLYNFSPSFGTPLSFVQRDTFHFSKVYMGWLETLGALANIVGAMLYWKFSKHLNMSKALFYSVFVGAITTLGYLYYTPTTVVIYDITNSIIGMFVLLMTLDFAARKTQNGLEAVSFALLCSVNNLASTCNSLTGAWLFPIVGLNPLIIISAFTTLLCLPLLKRIKFDKPIMSQNLC